MTHHRNPGPRRRGLSVVLAGLMLTAACGSSDGNRVLVRPNSGGENVFMWRVTGDELSLDLVSTTEPPYEGVPAETYQRGLYTTSPFRSAS